MPKIILDFTGCKYFMQVHERLKKAFGFPDYYGNNWDALWDCMDDYCWPSMLVLIKGIDSLPKDWLDYLKIMFEIFQEISEEKPGIEFRSLS